MQFLYKSNSDAASAPEVDICPVCLNVPGIKNVAITACGHKFCTSCLLSSLNKKNTCPICRTEIEPARECIEPLPVSVASEIIRDQERANNIHRKIAIINTFSGVNGRASMIFTLCRDIAFATAHRIAKWQRMSSETYHNSWEDFDSSDDEESENESEDE